MNINLIKEELERIVDIDCIKYNEPMKNHTSFRVGGPVDILVVPDRIEQVERIIDLCKKHKIDYFVMGNGSNLIVRDGGFRGVIIKLTALNGIKIDGNMAMAEAGALLSILSKEILKCSLKGFEFASGIPGTVGGAVAMNAGAYGPEIKDIIESVSVLNNDGNIISLSNEEMDFSYRNSVVQKKGYIVLEAVFRLENGNYDEIKNRMDELNRRRTDKQPLNYPSAGSTFKRPEGYFAGKLIEDSGLKGKAIGGACVSEKHAGFIINYNNASAADVLGLINFVKETVKKNYGVALEAEVKVIGEE